MLYHDSRQTVFTVNILKYQWVTQTYSLLIYEEIFLCFFFQLLSSPFSICILIRQKCVLHTTPALTQKGQGQSSSFSDRLLGPPTPPAALGGGGSGPHPPTLLPPTEPTPCCFSNASAFRPEIGSHLQRSSKNRTEFLRPFTPPHPVLTSYITRVSTRRSALMRTLRLACRPWAESPAAHTGLPWGPEPSPGGSTTSAVLTPGRRLHLSGRFRRPRPKADFQGLHATSF